MLKISSSSIFFVLFIFALSNVPIQVQAQTSGDIRIVIHEPENNSSTLDNEIKIAAEVHSSNEIKSVVVHTPKGIIPIGGRVLPIEGRVILIEGRVIYERVPLSLGRNEIIIEAIDDAGNRKTEILVVNRLEKVEHMFAVYLKTTGRITSLGAEYSLGAIINRCECLTKDYPQFGYVILDNYPNREDIWNNSSEYIFDVNENRIRKRTPEERKALERELRELYLEDILESIEPLPYNRIRATLQWSTYRMYIETNSTVLGVKFDSDKKQMFIEISGERGTSGALDLLLPVELVPSTKDLSVYLDGSPIDFSLTRIEDYYSVHVDYTHSVRTLTVNLISLPAWYEQPLGIAAIGGSLVALVIALLLVRRRLAR